MVLEKGGRLRRRGKKKENFFESRRRGKREEGVIAAEARREKKALGELSLREKKESLERERKRIYFQEGTHLRQLICRKKEGGRNITKGGKERLS